MEREQPTSAPRAQAASFASVAALFGRLTALALALGIALGLLLTAAAVALPAPAAEQETGEGCATSGSFLMRRGHDERWVMAPTLSTEVSYRVAGVVARASGWPLAPREGRTIGGQLGTADAPGPLTRAGGRRPRTRASPP